MTIKSELNIDRLEELAKKATPGPWTYGDNRDGLGNMLHPAKYPGKYSPIANFEFTEEEDAEYLANCNPETILELIRRLREAESRNNLQ